MLKFQWLWEFLLFVFWGGNYIIEVGGGGVGSGSKG